MMFTTLLSTLLHCWEILFNTEFSMTRREMLKSEVAPANKSLCHEPQPITTMLFGDELPQRFCNISQIKRMAAKSIGHDRRKGSSSTSASTNFKKPRVNTSGYSRAYDSAYDSDFRFSLGHKLSYDSDYDSDSDSVVSENQPWDSLLVWTARSGYYHCKGAFVWDQSGIGIIGIMQVSVCLGAILIPEYLDSILAILLPGAE